MKTSNPPVLDGHNDVLQCIYQPRDGQARPFFDRTDQGHMDLPRMRAGGFGGGFFAVFVSSQSFRERSVPGVEADSGEAAYHLPLESPVNLEHARAVTIRGMATLFRLERLSRGQLKVVCTVDELTAALGSGVVAAILHFEGAEAIDPELNALEVFYRAGLRSLGIAWSRSNDFAHGVPFRFPHSPDTGPGLSDAGRALVKACNDFGILVDLAHTNEQGFWDAAGITAAPLVVTHAGVHALCPSTRNLTDRQLDAVGESGGVVGVNFHVGFLRRDGRRDPDTPLEEIVRHVDYIAGRIGIDHVALGSDFDGAVMPKELGDVAGLPRLIAAFRSRGYDRESLEKVCSRNWIRVLGGTWK